MINPAIQLHVLAAMGEIVHVYLLQYIVHAITHDIYLAGPRS